MYVDIYIEPGQTPHQKVLVREPVTPAYDRLRFTNRDDMAVLPPILDMMEFVVDELRAARMASPGYGVPVASEAQRSVNVVGNPAEERAVTNASPSARHTFQSFWHGGALSPYELFCLKSFIDCGYAVDLYTYDLKLVAPAGVRVCDAAELVSRDEVFVYQAEGFGKGSPSAFSNYFRYKLLAERGGWWIDTDVVCLTDCIPVVNEFFARQDKDFVACGTMYFPPRHPIMLRCLEQTIKLGRTVKWGNTGPHMLTRVLEERGSLSIGPLRRRSAIPFITARHWISCDRRKRPSWRPGSKRLCFFISGIPCSFIVAFRKPVFPRKDRCCAGGWTSTRSTDGPGNMTTPPWRAP